MTSTGLHQKSVKLASDRHVQVVELVVVGMRNAVDREVSSPPPRYDSKPVRFALNQGSRKLCSGGVTCPGLIRCAGLEHVYYRPSFEAVVGRKEIKTPYNVIILRNYLSLTLPVQGAMDTAYSILDFAGQARQTTEI